MNNDFASEMQKLLGNTVASAQDYKFYNNMEDIKKLTDAFDLSRHIALSSPPGRGKSTLVGRFIAPHFEAAAGVIPIRCDMSGYSDPFMAFKLALQDAIRAQMTTWDKATKEKYSTSSTKLSLNFGVAKAESEVKQDHRAHMAIHDDVKDMLDVLFDLEKPIFFDFQKAEALLTSKEGKEFQAFLASLFHRIEQSPNHQKTPIFSVMEFSSKAAAQRIVHGSNNLAAPLKGVIRHIDWKGWGEKFVTDVLHDGLANGKYLKQQEMDDCLHTWDLTRRKPQVFCRLAHDMKSKQIPVSGIIQHWHDNRAKLDPDRLDFEDKWDRLTATAQAALKYLALREKGTKVDCHDPDTLDAIQELGHDEMSSLSIESALEELKNTSWVFQNFKDEVRFENEQEREFILYLVENAESHNHSYAIDQKYIVTSASIPVEIDFNGIDIDSALLQNFSAPEPSIKR